MDQIYTVKMPDIGEGVVEGEVIEWLKQVNDPLKQDEPVVIVMTDKATVELPAPYPGKLLKQYYKVGQKAIKDKPLYDIEVSARENVHAEEKDSVKPIEEHSEEMASAQKSLKKGDRSVLALPKVRKLAEQLGVDLEKIKGTGHEGQVTLDDLQHAFHASPETASPITHLSHDEESEITGIRNLMAKKMAESKRLIPHFSYFEECDATRLVQLRLKVKEDALKEGIHVTFMPFFIKALSLTLKQFPQVNSSMDMAQNKLLIHQQHNIGIAINTPLGLIVPVLKNVQELSLADIIRTYEDLKKRALSNKLKNQEMKDSTITISNYGVLGGGGMWATPIINYPEAAILALARIQKQAVVKNNQVVVRDTLHLSWSFDHRIIDGNGAANCSHFFATLIQNPAALL